MLDYDSQKFVKINIFRTRTTIYFFVSSKNVTKMLSHTFLIKNHVLDHPKNLFKITSNTLKSSIPVIILSFTYVLHNIIK